MKAKHAVIWLGAFLVICCFGLLVISARDLFMNDQIGKNAQRTPRDPFCVVEATLDHSPKNFVVYVRAEGEGSSDFCHKLISTPDAIKGFTATYRTVSTAPAYTVWCQRGDRYLYITLISNEIAAMNACSDLLP